MTPRQLAFVREYLKDMNATAAMVRAGYSARTANKHTPRLMGHPEVRELIDAATADRNAAVLIEATDTIHELADEARSELRAAREYLNTAGRRLRDATATILDIELLRKTPVKSAPKPQPSLPRSHVRPPFVAADHAEYRPLMPAPEPQRFQGAMSDDYRPFED